MKRKKNSAVHRVRFFQDPAIDLFPLFFCKLYQRVSSDESPLWALAPIYIIQSSVVKVCSSDTCILGQEFLRNFMQKAKVTSQAEYKKYLSVTRIDKKASEEEETLPVPNANILSYFCSIFLLTNVAFHLLRLLQC